MMKSLFKLICVAFAVTLAVFIAMAMPPTAWGWLIYGGLILAGIALVSFVAYLFMRASQKHTYQMVNRVAQVAERAQDNLMQYALSSQAMQVIERRLEQGVRIWQEDNGRLILEMPDGQILPARQALKTQDAIDYMVERQQYYLPE